MTTPLNSPAAKSLIDHLPIVILFRAVRELFASQGRRTTLPQGNLPSASFR